MTVDTGNIHAPLTAPQKQRGAFRHVQSDVRVALPAAAKLPTSLRTFYFILNVSIAFLIDQSLKMNCVNFTTDKRLKAFTVCEVTLLLRS